MKFPLFPSLLLLLSACASTKVASGEAGAGAVPRQLSSQSLTWQTKGSVETAKAPDGLLVVRADLKSSELLLLTSPATDDKTVSEVAIQNNLLVAINAAMFKQDYKTSLGYMRNFADVNNSSFNNKLGGYLLFHPKRADLPLVKVGAKTDLADYDTAFQTYRMWTDADGILWKSGASVYARVGLVGVDKDGRLLLFYHPSSIDVHDLVDEILQLDLNLTGLLYLDGGFHGAFYEAGRVGETWNAEIHLPNLLGLKPKQASK